MSIKQLLLSAGTVAAVVSIIVTATNTPSAMKQRIAALPNNLRKVQTTELVDIREEVLRQMRVSDDVLDTAYFLDPTARTPRSTATFQRAEGANRQVIGIDADGQVQNGGLMDLSERLYQELVQRGLPE